MSSIRMEKWILEFALKHDYLELATALVNGLGSQREGIADVYWLITSLRSIVETESFADYHVASRIVKLLEHHLQPKLALLGEQDPHRAKQVYELIVLLKALHLLSRIGRATSGFILELLNETFPPLRNGEHTDTQAECAGGDMQKKFELETVGSAMYPTLREYVLKILMHPSRQQHFLEHKFPGTFKDLMVRVQLLADQYVHTFCGVAGFGMELEKLSHDRSTSQLQSLEPDVAVFLYAEILPKDRFPTEKELACFVKVLHENKSSVDTPNLLQLFQSQMAESQPISNQSPIPAINNSPSQQIVVPQSNANNHQNVMAPIDRIFEKTLQQSRSQSRSDFNDFSCAESHVSDTPIDTRDLHNRISRDIERISTMENDMMICSTPLPYEFDDRPSSSSDPRSSLITVSSGESRHSHPKSGLSMSRTDVWEISSTISVPSQSTYSQRPRFKPEYFHPPEIKPRSHKRKQSSSPPDNNSPKKKGRPRSKLSPNTRGRPRKFKSPPPPPVAQPQPSPLVISDVNLTPERAMTPMPEPKSKSKPKPKTPPKAKVIVPPKGDGLKIKLTIPGRTRKTPNSPPFKKPAAIKEPEENWNEIVKPCSVVLEPIDYQEESDEEVSREVAPILRRSVSPQKHPKDPRNPQPVADASSITPVIPTDSINNLNPVRRRSIDHTTPTNFENELETLMEIENVCENIARESHSPQIIDNSQNGNDNNSQYKAQDLDVPPPFTSVAGVSTPRRATVDYNDPYEDCIIGDNCWIGEIPESAKTPSHLSMSSHTIISRAPSVASVIAPQNDEEDEFGQIRQLQTPQHVPSFRTPHYESSFRTPHYEPSFRTPHYEREPSFQNVSTEVFYTQSTPLERNLPTSTSANSLDNCRVLPENVITVSSGTTSNGTHDSGGTVNLDSSGTIQLD